MFRKLLATALASAMMLQTAAAFPQEGPVFRYKWASAWTDGAGPIGGGTDDPGDDPGNPGEPEGPTVPTYYRVVVQNFHGPGSLAEVAFVNGNQIIPPAEADIDAPSGDKQAAFDGNPNTGWKADEASVVKVVYGIGDDSVPNALDLTALDPDGPVSFVIEKSFNGVSWTPVIAYANEPEWSPGETRRYPFDVNPPNPDEEEGHRYWRVSIENFNWDGYYNGVGEIQFKNGAGQDVTTGGQGYSDVPGTLPGRVWDKHPTNGWLGTYRKNVTGSFWYDFGEPRVIKSVDITSSSDHAPQQFRIESSDDARIWTIRAHYRGQGGWGNGETRNYPIPNPTYPADYHQFWRVRITKSNNPSYTGAMNDLRFFGEGGADIHARSVPIASGGEPRELSDNANGNAWRVTDPTPWAGYVFPQPVKAETVMIRGSSTSTPRDFVVEWSDDGLTWVSEAHHKGNGSWGSYERRDYPVKQPVYPPDHYRFWRIAMNKTVTEESQRVTLREMDFRDALGNSLTGKGVPIGGESAAWFEHSGAFNGQYNSSYNGNWNSAGVPTWIGYEFDRPVRPQDLVIWNQKVDGSLDDSARDFLVQYSVEGDTWVTTADYKGHGDWKWDEPRTFPIFNTPDNGPGHQFWRVLVKATNGGDTAVVREIRFLPQDQSNHHVLGDPIERHSNWNWTRAAAAFDNDLGSSWNASMTKGSEPYIGYAFTHRVPVHEVHIMAENAAGAPRDFDIQYSDDDENWTTVVSYTGAAGWGVNETRIFPIVKPTPGPNEAYLYRIQFVNGCVSTSPGNVRANNIKLMTDITGYTNDYRTDPIGTVIPLTGVVTVAEEGAASGWMNAFDQHGYTQWSSPFFGPTVTFLIEHALPTKIENYDYDFWPSCPTNERTSYMEKWDGHEWDPVAIRHYFLPLNMEVVRD